MPKLRVPSTAPLAAVALGGMLALSGCDTLNTASDTLDKAEVCTRAMSAAGYTPDLSDPQKSVDDAQARADELRELAEQTSDADLQRELREMADEVGSLQVSDVNPVAAAEWASEMLDQVNQLQQACGG